MMMAKLPPALLVADLLKDEGEFLDSRDDDFLAALDESGAGRPSGRRAPTVADTWEYCLMVSRIWRSRMRRSVTTMIESKTGALSFSRPISWWASQAMELLLPLPAECWIR